LSGNIIDPLSHKPAGYAVAVQNKSSFLCQPPPQQPKPGSLLPGSSVKMRGVGEKSQDE